MLLVQLFKLEISINNSSEISLNVQKGSLGAKEGTSAAARVSAYMIRFASRLLQRLLATHSPESYCLSSLPPGHKNIVFLASDTKVNREESMTSVGWAGSGFRLTVWSLLEHKERDS